MDVETVALNGFQLHFSSPTFSAFIQAMPDNRQLSELKERAGDAWFLYWINGEAFGLPNRENPPTRFGTPRELRCQDHLKVLSARIVDVLPRTFPGYHSFRKRPFTILGKQDLVQVVCGRLRGLPPQVQQFHIRKLFELDAKLLELVEGQLSVGLFLRVRTRWEILAPLTDLADAGVDLSGAYVVRANPEPGQRRLVGKIGSLADGMVELSESFDGSIQVPVGGLRLEGSKSSFIRCLKCLLGQRYAAFEEELNRQEAGVFTGPALNERLEKLGRSLVKASPLDLGSGLACTVGERVTVGRGGEYQSLVRAAPVQYCFDAAKTKRHQYAWAGLERFGPFSRDTFPKKSPRIVVFFPDIVQGPVENFLRLLRDGVTIERSSQYAAGFARTYGLVNPVLDLQRIRWLGSTHQQAAAAYRRAAEAYLTAEAAPPDAAIVVILEEHARLPDRENPYLQVKAVLLMAGVPVQEIRVPTLSKRPYDLQYILQDFSVQLYAKMHGTPWTVDHDLTINDELVIGMGTCELSGSRFTERQRYIGVTTVFRADGNYLLSNLSRECRYEEYPQVLRETTLDVLSEIRQRNGWLPGDAVRIVFHVYKPLRDVEVAAIMAECVDALRPNYNVEFAFLTVSHDHPFMALDLSRPGIPAGLRSSAKKAVYVPERGTIVHVGRYTRLRCTNGPRQVKQENSPLPAPLLVHLHPESTFRDLQYLTEQVLKFTSLSWRSTRPTRKPVTIYYSELIAELLARLRGIPDWSPAMLNVKLRASQWFL